MISDGTLDLAVERGIISPDQATELRGLEALTCDDAFTIEAATEAPTEKDDEEIRLVGSFGDVFVTLGLALVLGPLAYVAYLQIGILAMWLTLLVTSWLLAEVFTRRRRLALPSIVLLIVFVCAAFFACEWLAAFLLSDQLPPETLPTLWEPSLNSVTTGLASILTFGVLAPHWWRFHVPVTIAGGAAVMSLAVLSLGHRLAEIAPQAATLMMLACGLAVFALAMRFDLSDRRRATQRADIAFWLHLLAAPMIVHPLMSFFGATIWSETNSAAAVLAVFAVLALVAIVIDRRALLLSGLLYAGAAIAVFVGAAGLTGTLVPVAALTLGLVVLALSAGWRPLRNATLRLLPRTFVRRLPYPTGAQAL